MRRTTRPLSILLLLAAFATARGATPEAIENFTGDLREGSTYRAAIVLDESQEWRTAVRLKMPRHHAARIEWLNLKDYPELNKPERGFHQKRGSHQKQIVFHVVRRETYKVAGQYRWNTTYYCRITAIE